MQELQHEVEHLEELKGLAEEIVGLAQDSKLILFQGDLGSGKTTLIKNICNFLNVKQEVTSPTFSLVNQYQTETGEKVFHFDLYRLESLDEVLDIGFEEYLDSGNWCLIEWPEIVDELIDGDHLTVDLKVLGNKRIVNISKHS